MVVRLHVCTELVKGLGVIPLFQVRQFVDDDHLQEFKRSVFE